MGLLNDCKVLLKTALLYQSIFSVKSVQNFCEKARFWMNMQEI